MKDFPQVILGAGRQAGHVLHLLEWMGLPWDSCLIYDDGFAQSKIGARGLPIHGTLDSGISICVEKKLPAIIALGSRVAAARYNVFQRAAAAGVELRNLIHPSCWIAPSARIGKNVVMMPGCVVGPNVEVGSPSCLFSNVTLEHDCKVGDNVVLGPGCTLSGLVQIGSHCFLGAGVVCAPEVNVSDGTLVGAGAVVTSDLPSSTVCYGVPAVVKRLARAADDIPTSDQLRELSRKSALPR